jgi:beta-lactamase regulating signal transducer with metallopeptidase domain
MNVISFGDPFLILQSLAVGAVAAACVALCPGRGGSLIRQAVPVAAFGALLVLVLTLLLPSVSRLLPAPDAIANAVSKNQLAPIAWVWLAGCALFLARLAHGTWTVWRIVRSTQPVPGRAWQQLLDECQRALGLRGRVRLRLAGPGFVPSAAGLLRRTVLLPDEALHWTREQRKLVLMHELGHFRRGDLWAHALGRLACALHWFNPFVWVLHRQLAIEREFACDQLVIARGAEPDDYATLLFEMATAARRRPVSEAAFLTMASRRTGKLEARVRRILSPVRKAGRWMRLADCTLCAVLALTLVVCAAGKPRQGSKVWTPEEIEARLAAETFAD